MMINFWIFVFWTNFESSTCISLKFRIQNISVSLVDMLTWSQQVPFRELFVKYLSSRWHLKWTVDTECQFVKSPTTVLNHFSHRDGIRPRNRPRAPFSSTSTPSCVISRAEPESGHEIARELRFSARSAERRVAKGGRSGWWRYHSRKNRS